MKMEQIQISADYIQAAKTIKQAILDSRYRAVRHVNKEILTLYYWVGNYVSVNSRAGTWNTNAISTISQLLQQELPGLTGFSETNIKNMRTFYEVWSPVLNRQPLAAEIGNIQIVKELQNRQPAVADLTTDDLECFMNIGFTHHREIIRKTQTLDERLFYIRKCAKEFWSKETLKYHLNENLYAKPKTSICWISSMLKTLILWTKGKLSKALYKMSRTSSWLLAPILPLWATSIGLKWLERSL